MKRYKIFLCAILAAIFLFTGNVFAAESANEMLKKIELTTYGREQTGALIDRLNKLEKDYSGKNLEGNLNTRLQALYAIIYENSGSPSILAKVNALEWNLNHAAEIDGLDSRISNLENTILGKLNEGNFIYRIRELAKASFGSEDIPLVEMQLPADTLIKAELIDSVDTRTAQVGDTINFRVAEDVIIDGNLIFAKGLPGQGTAAVVDKATGWGKNGKLVIDNLKVEVIDGQQVEAYVGYESESIMKENKMVSGAALFGVNLKSQWDKVMVHGKNLEVPAGTEFFLQTKSDTAIYALKGGRGSVAIENDVVEEYDVDLNE